MSKIRRKKLEQKEGMPKYYAVKSGRVPGVYLTWEECEAQVKGFSNNCHQRFSTYREALAFVDQAQTHQHTSQSIVRNRQTEYKSTQSAVERSSLSNYRYSPYQPPTTTNRSEDFLEYENGYGAYTSSDEEEDDPFSVFSSENVNLLLSYGVKPWDDDAISFLFELKKMHIA